MLSGARAVEAASQPLTVTRSGRRGRCRTTSFSRPARSLRVERGGWRRLRTSGLTRECKRSAASGRWARLRTWHYAELYTVTGDYAARRDLWHRRCGVWLIVRRRPAQVSAVRRWRPRCVPQTASLDRDDSGAASRTTPAERCGRTQRSSRTPVPCCVSPSALDDKAGIAAGGRGSGAEGLVQVVEHFGGGDGCEPVPQARERCGAWRSCGLLASDDLAV